MLADIINVMIITHHREKLINAIIYFANHTKYCGKTKLLKLLYFLDFFHFKQAGKSVTGLYYYAWEMGPVPKDLFEELSGNMKPDMKSAINELPGEGFQQIRPKKKFDSRCFSNKEMKLLDDISFIFKDAKADNMVESTHLKNEPWDKTLREKGEFQKIDYMLAVDSELISLPYDEAKERMEERSEMYKILGVD
ncbi:MAG: SocA family protein [Desulfobacterales bacterium]|uniref:SocA family protein n=1 Tax=Candidatus Desulfatibia vada TaxID=2841696 RepID=A0A8J6NTN7_9BACT|nr:SocA family protein [Candidatus Desulfatibia vada]